MMRDHIDTKLGGTDKKSNSGLKTRYHSGLKRCHIVTAKSLKGGGGFGQRESKEMTVRGETA